MKKECQCGIGTSLPGPDITHRDAVILFPLHPASPTHKYPQRHKIIHGMHPAGRKDRSIDRFEDFLVRYPVHVISVAVVFKDAYLY